MAADWADGAGGERTFAWLNQFRRLSVRYENGRTFMRHLCLGVRSDLWRFLRVDWAAN